MGTNRRGPDHDQLVSRAEELITRLGQTALRGSDKFLDPAHWMSWCDSTVEFYYEYHNQVERSLAYLLAQAGEKQPDILSFLVTAELDRRFAPISLAGATYSQLLIVIKYVLAQVVSRQLAGRTDFSDLQPLASAAFQSLWKLIGSAETDSKERWQASEMLLDLAFGRYAEVVDAYNQKYAFDLAAYENSYRTIIKECYMLARIATGHSDDDLTFGAAALCTLSKFNYYLWLVNENLSAQIDLVTLVLVCQLYEQVGKGRTLSMRDCFQMLQPGAVVGEMNALKHA